MLSIVIPVYNEVESLEPLYQRILGSSTAWAMPFEVIIVDDGCTDGSSSSIRSMSERDRRFIHVKLSRNFGHQAALAAGIAVAKGQAVILMDADLQDPPEVIRTFLDKWQHGFDVVFGIRTDRKESVIKRSSYAFFYRLFRFVGKVPMPLDSGDFCLMDRKVVDVMVKQMPEHHRFIRGLRAYAGFKQVGVPYERAARANGVSKYSLKQLLRLAFDGLFDYSTVFLRSASYLGFSIAIIFFLLGVFFIFHRVLEFKIFGYSPADVPGLATLAVGLFFLGGLMLMILGIIGEYIGRIYFEVKNRPAYIVEEVYQSKKSETSE